jgi:probable phosphoglycerate mutase
LATRQPEIVLVRHGETEWSRAGKHTGRTDVPLTEQGKREAAAIRVVLGERGFGVVLTSPLGRAEETCRLAGYGDQAIRSPDLMEWDYGAYEGVTTAEIRKKRPGWTLWHDGVPDGETAADVAVRADRALARLLARPGDVLIFAHGHFLRVLAARWLGLQPSEGRLFALDPATISVLGHEREAPVIRLWNRSCTTQVS